MSRMYSLIVGHRRWILTVMLLLLTLGGARVAMVRLPKAYQSGSSVVLLASRQASKSNGGNPYLSFSPSLTLTADLLSRELAAPATVSYLASHGFRACYTVALSATSASTAGSVLLITVSGTDKAGVERTLHGVTNEISATLLRLQAGESAYHRIRALTVAFTKQPTLSVSQTARPLVLLAGLGLALSFGIPWIIEAQVTERRPTPADGAAIRMPYPDEHAPDSRWPAVGTLPKVSVGSHADDERRSRHPAAATAPNGHQLASAASDFARPGDGATESMARPER